MVNLTINQLLEACCNNSYIAVRDKDGDTLGINCKVAPIALKKADKNRESLTWVVGYYPISFHEYIRIKSPFYTTYN